MHGSVFSSTPGLYPWMPVAPSSCGNQKHVQKLHMSRGDGGANHCFEEGIEETGKPGSSEGQAPGREMCALEGNQEKRDLEAPK